MAFLAVPGFNTPTTAAISSSVGLVLIDPSVAAIFAAQLGSNYTYASISDGVNYEVIQITGVSGSDLLVTRAQDGTAASAFPVGACIRYVWATEGIVAVAAGGSLVLTAAGAVGVTQTGPNAWTIDVPVPTIGSTLPIEVLGAYPAWSVDFQGTYGACCCGGSSGGGSGGTIALITGSGLASVTGGAGPTANISVPVFNPIAGTNMTITGTWPNITFNAAGGGSGGIVTSVTGSTKILVSGATATPTVNLSTTGIGANTFNGITWDAWGTLTSFDPTWIALRTVSSTNLGVTFTITGTNSSFHIPDTTTSQRGLSILAPATAIGSNNAGDPTSSVTPAGINAVLAAYVPPAPIPVIEVISSSYTADAPGSYTNTLASSILVPALSATASATITASASVTDSSVSTPPTWGLAVFVGAGLIQGVKSIFTGTHHIRFVLTGPMGATTYILKTSTLSGTTTVVTQEIDAMVLPG